MRNGLILRALLVLLLGWASVLAPEGKAQQRRGLFVGPRAQTTQLLGDPALLVGVRVGPHRAEGVSFDLGFDLLATPVSRNPGPYFGDEISRLGRLSVGLRYNGGLVGPLRYDVGGTASAGLYSGTFCGGTDSCAGAGPGPYLGARPEVGVRLAFSDRLALRLSGGYAIHWLLVGPEMNGMVIGLGVRVSP